MIEKNIFKLIVTIVGAFIIFAGINVGFGGIETLGWQVSKGFIDVTNPSDFIIQDSHVRFLGGAFGTVGLFLLLAMTNIKRYQTGLQLVFVLMLIGGLSRLTGPQPGVVLNPNVVTSFLAEILLAPILFFWMHRIVKADLN